MCLCGSSSHSSETQPQNTHPNTVLCSPITWLVFSFSPATLSNPFSHTASAAGSPLKAPSNLLPHIHLHMLIYLRLHLQTLLTEEQSYTHNTIFSSLLSFFFALFRFAQGKLVPYFYLAFVYELTCYKNTHTQRIVWNINLAHLIKLFPAEHLWRKHQRCESTESHFR